MLRLRMHCAPDSGAHGGSDDAALGVSDAPADPHADVQADSCAHAVPVDGVDQVGRLQRKLRAGRDPVAV